MTKITTDDLGIFEGKHSKIKKFPESHTCTKKKKGIYNSLVIFIKHEGKRERNIITETEKQSGESLQSFTVTLSSELQPER